MDQEMQQALDKYHEMRQKYLQGGTPGAIARQHASGKLTARERLELLVDPGSFMEYDLFINRHPPEFGLGEVDAPTEGFIGGVAKIDGRPVAVCIQDFTIVGGSVGLWGSKKMMKIVNLALTYRIPLIMVNDSGGARPQEQHDARVEGYTNLFNFHSIASGVMPQISLVMGPVAGGPCYAPALTDLILATKKTGCMFIGGPSVVKAVTGEDVTDEQLGGAGMHATVSGVVDLAVDTDQELLKLTRELLSYLPSNCKEKPPVIDPGDNPERKSPDLLDIVSGNANKPYNMHEVIKRIVDGGKIFELKPTYAPNLITCFARFGGQSVGILASQPAVMAGVMDWKASWKAARFVRFCDCFNVPLLHLVDTPAYLVGTRSEREGIIRHGAQLLYAESEATVPVVTLILRKGYAGAASAMGSRHLKVSDYLMAWPCAEVALFGVEAGMSILMRSREMKKQLEEAPDKEAHMKKLKEQYYKSYVDLYSVAPVRYVDDIIEPEDTRSHIIKALRLLQNRTKENPWKKHGNMPL